MKFKLNYLPLTMSKIEIGAKNISTNRQTKYDLKIYRLLFLVVKYVYTKIGSCTIKTIYLSCQNKSVYRQFWKDGQTEGRTM